MKTRHFFYLLVVLAGLLEGCKPENIQIPLNADPKNPSGSSKPSLPPIASPASEAPEPPRIAAPAAHDDSPQALSTLQPSSAAAASLPGASPSSRSTAPLLPSKEREELETKSDCSLVKPAESLTYTPRASQTYLGSSLAPAGDITLIRNSAPTHPSIPDKETQLSIKSSIEKTKEHYNRNKQENQQYQLPEEDISTLCKHCKDLASDPSPQSQELRNEIIQFLQEVAPHAIPTLGSEPSQALSIAPPDPIRDISLADVNPFSPVTTTKELVQYFNNPDLKVMRPWLRSHCLQVYLECFANAGPLQAADLEEYSALTDLDPEVPENRRLLRNYFESLYLRLQACKKKEEENALMQGLDRILPMIDPDVFEGGSSQIIDLGFFLLERLDPSRNVFTKSNYPTYSPILDALNQTLVLIQQVAPREWNVKRENRPYQKIKSQLEDIAKLDNCYSRYSNDCCNCYSSCCCPTESDTYYPCVYKIQLILQSLARLEAAPNRLEYLLRAGGGLRGVCHGAQAILDLIPVINGKKVPSLNINDAADAYTHLKKAIRGQRIHKEEWYSHLETMAEHTLNSFTDPEEYKRFTKGLEDLEDLHLKRKQGFFCTKKKINLPFIEKRAARLALHYGLVSQLSRLALYSEHTGVREQSLQWLVKLARKETWQKDQEIVTAILEALAAVANYPKHKSEAEAARRELDELISLQHEDSTRCCRLPFQVALRCCRPPFQVALEHWLDDEDLETKLKQAAKRLVDDLPPAQHRLFKEVNKQLADAQEAAVIQKEASNAIEYLEKQVHEYLREEFPHEDPEAVRQTLGSLALERFKNEKAGPPYYFPSPGFQAYFAGRELARLFLSTGEEYKQAIDFLANYKHVPLCETALSCMAEKVCQEQGLAGIQSLLRELDELPKGAPGPSYLLLQLRCLNEFLRVGSLDLGEEGCKTLDEEFDLIKPFNAYLEKVLQELKRGRPDIQKQLIGNFSGLGHVLGRSNACNLYIQALKDGREAVYKAADEALKALAQAAPKETVRNLVAIWEAEPAAYEALTEHYTMKQLIEYWLHNRIEELGNLIARISWLKPISFDPENGRIELLYEKKDRYLYALPEDVSVLQKLVDEYNSR